MLSYLAHKYKEKKADLTDDRMLKLFMYDLIVNDGLYDILKYPFHVETQNIASTAKYISLRERKPSAPLNLCKSVVEDCASLLFGENHFPQIHIKDRTTREILKSIDKCINFKKIFADAVKYGSIGSVAFLVGVIDGQPFILPKKTIYLTPEFDNEKTKNLVRITEKYQTTGRCLRTIGYNIEDSDLDAEFWYQCEWTREKEIYYIPWKVEARFIYVDKKKSRENEKPPQVDTERTIEHGLGFVPIVWVQNLPGGDAIDGKCTFDSGIETMIERDYLMSQGGRGLRYSCDPLLLIKSDSLTLEEPYIKSADNALHLPKDGDARLLEITGGAVDALAKFAKVLREQALEAIHGNRSDANKLSVAQSGRAMEMMNQDLIWLCETLRNCYGELGLVKVIEMLLRIADTTTILVKGKPIGKVKSDEDVVLIWPSWYAPTPDDMQKTALSIDMFRRSKVVGQKTAIKSIASMFDIEDIDEEVEEINSDDDLEKSSSELNPTESESHRESSKKDKDEVDNDRAGEQ